MNDLISRQEAINKILEYFIEYHGGAFREDDQRALIEVFKKMPTMPSYDDGKKDGAIEAFQIISLQPSNCDVDDGKQTCLECEEYDKEKYYCPKFCDVIRNAVDDIRKDNIPVLYIKETIAWAKENGSTDYADYLTHLLSVWAERNE